MKAREIMTSDVVTLSPDTPIQQIARLFRRLGITGAPVVDRGEIIGIVTEIDLIARHAKPIVPYYLPLLGASIPLAGYRERRETLRRILGTCARDIMTSPVKTVDVEADLEEVATLMVESRANPVPVTQDGRLVGIIGHSDLLQHLEVAPDFDLEESGGANDSNV